MCRLLATCNISAIFLLSCTLHRELTLFLCNFLFSPSFLVFSHYFNSMCQNFREILCISKNTSGMHSQASQQGGNYVFEYSISPYQVTFKTFLLLCSCLKIKIGVLEISMVYISKSLGLSYIIYKPTNLCNFVL